MSSSSTSGDAEHAALVPSATAVVPADLPAELPLRPLEGIPRWFGRLLHRVLFRAASMVEQPLHNMEGPITPNEGYFRRDRHRHPAIDPATYSLQVSGVARPRSFSLAELRALPQERRVLVMECAGNGNHLMGSAGLVGQARWTGPALEAVLEACGGPGAATHFAFHGLDPIPLVRRGYHYGLALEELVQARALLALEMNGDPLPRPRGFPVRLVVPGIYSMSHVKWLGHVEGKGQPHDGVHNTWVFTNKRRVDGAWVREQARWIGLKSLVTRALRVEGGLRLTGWAWGGASPIDRVEISIDGGASWHAATLQSPREYFEAEMPAAHFERAWAVFDYLWRDPAPGRHVVACRAFAADGTAQRLDQDPDVKGHFDQTRVKWREIVIPG